MRKFFSKVNLSKPINIYRVGLLIVLFIALLIVPFTLVNVAFLLFYLIVAFIGLHLFELHGYRIYHLAQLGFLFFTVYLFAGGNILQLAESDFILSGFINAVFFFASYSLIIFYFFVVLFRFVKSIKRQNLFFLSVISLLWADSSYRIFFFNPDFGASLGFAFLGFFVVSTVSFIIIQRKVIKKIYLVFFQAAFFGSLLFSVYYISFFEKEVIIDNALDKYIIGTWGLTSISLIWLFLDRLFITYWRRKLVEIPQNLDTGKPISIYPDATIYKDVHHNAAWLDKFIRTSDGGVVGLTGVRGAGKSALLNKILVDLDKEYFTLHITSPVHSSDRMEFFMMVCREVCSKVIREVNTKIFHSKNTVISIATEGLIRRIRYLLLFIVVIAGIIVAFDQGLLSGRFEFMGSQITGVQSHRDPEDDLLKADHDCIAKLVVELDKFQADNSSLQQAIILPRADQSQLHLMPVLDSQVDIVNTYNIFMKHYDWMDSTGWHNLSLYQTKHGGNSMHLNNQVLSSAEMLFDGSRLNSEVFNTIYFTQLIRPDIYNNLSFHNPLDYYDPQIFWYIEHFSILIDSIIGTTQSLYERSFLNESQVAHYVHTVGKIFNIEPSFSDIDSDESFPKLMSWLLLEAFITHAHNGEKELLLLDRNTSIPKLKDVLINYLKLFPSYYGATPISTGTQSVSLQSPSILNTLNSTIYWLLTGLFLLILSGGFIYKWFSFFMVSIVNFKAFGLLQQSKQFLSLLSYSESTERSGNLSVWDWLSFSASKTKTERELTLPAITNRFITYIKEVSASFNNKMIICIDELDKIDDPEVIRHILREIKGALFVKNTYYLISISEDAASSFETRLSSGRDIFESTFDEIIFLKRLYSEQTLEIIKLRLVEEEEIIRDLKIEKVKEGERDRQTNTELLKLNASVISIASGGIPREIIRNLREVLLKYTKFDLATPSQISVFLFRTKIEKLLNRAGEVSIAGDKTMELYNCLIEILNEIENGEKLAKDQISNVRVLLKKCLTIIDPDELSSSVTITSSEEQQASYNAIKTDLKSYIELLIFTDVIEYIQNNPTITEIDEQFEERIISTFSSLNKNPALALHILNE